MKLATDKALVIFSGGMDSTICLFWAIKTFGRDNVSTLTFDYAQRHRTEVQSARQIAEMAQVSWRLIEIPHLLASSGPLLSSAELEQHADLSQFPSGLQPTFIPARNILFFSLAASLAYELGAMHLVSGLCQADYGGYYDCRQDFLRSMQETLNQGLLGHSGKATQTERIQIHAPLMHLTKREEILFARSGFTLVSREALDEMNPADKELSQSCFEALAYSHSCYAGISPPCGLCHACHLRARAFDTADISDPLLERLLANA